MIGDASRDDFRGGALRSPRGDRSQTPAEISLHDAVMLRACIANVAAGLYVQQIDDIKLSVVRRRDAPCSRVISISGRQAVYSVR